MIAPVWKKFSVIMAVCVLIIAGIWAGILLNQPKEITTMKNGNNWTGNEIETEPINSKQSDIIEKATFALG